MSTIEKAASRLAARRKPDARPAAAPDERMRGVNGRAAPHAEVDVPSPLASADQGMAPARFCDIDLEGLHERGYLVPGAGRSQLSQEMRRIKRPLLMNLQKARATGEGGMAQATPPANLVMITSALPGEGKTFTSINLAMSIAAEVDRRVLLVDADVARGDISRQLGIPPMRGLSDLLHESNHLFEDAVLTSNVERLSILPSGSPSEQVDELFASDLMRVVTRDLAEADTSRIVIFDASPLLATTEASVLARHMGQTLVVVEAARTSRDAVTQAAAQLEGCTNVSLVLNKASGKDATGGYGYGYGYGYGSYEGPTDREGARVAAE